MVDGVELAVVDQVLDVGHLDDRHAIVLQQGRECPPRNRWCRPRGRAHCWHGSRRPACLRRQPLRQRALKKVFSVGTPAAWAAFTGPRRDRCPAPDALLHVVLEQVAVVARKLIARLSAPNPAPRSAPAHCPGVADQLIGERRVVGVVLAEQDLAGTVSRIWTSPQRAEHDLEREARLGLVQLTALVSRRPGVSDRGPGPAQSWCPQERQPSMRARSEPPGGRGSPWSSAAHRPMRPPRPVLHMGDALVALALELLQGETHLLVGLVELDDPAPRRPLGLEAMQRAGDLVAVDAVAARVGPASGANSIRQPGTISRTISASSRIW